MDYDSSDGSVEVGSWSPCRGSSDHNGAFHGLLPVVDKGG